MASTESTMTEVIVHRVRTKYHWPALQLNFWLLIMIIGSATILGVFADFMMVQSQMELGTPWLVLFFSIYLSLLCQVHKKVVPEEMEMLKATELT